MIFTNALFRTLLNRSYWKYKKHAAASKLYIYKLIILNAASFYVSMPPRSPSQTFKHKLGCQLNILGQGTPSVKIVFLKIKMSPFLT